MSGHVAVATCVGGEVDDDHDALATALALEGLQSTWCIWDDPTIEWDQFDLTVIRSTWDYANRVDEFRDWAWRVPRLVNDRDVVEFSSDKHYLAALAASGVPIVPTQFCEVGVPAMFPNGDFVVKPTVGAGSLDAARYSPHEVATARQHVESLHERGRDVMIQPYVHSVDEHGELALIFIDHQFSHAMVKRAMLNVPEDDRDVLFRRESMSLGAADATAIGFGTRVLAASGFSDLCYARVDLVRVAGRWAVMELELVEPALFLNYHPPAATALASALRRRCDQRPPR